MNSNQKEFITLSKIILEKKLENEVGIILGIKGSSVRRELNRIINFYCHPQKQVQKRSGRRRWEEYKCAMCEIAKRKVKRYCFKEINTKRIISFKRLDDALAYTEVIFYICCLTYDCETASWDVLIPENSDGIEPCICN